MRGYSFEPSNWINAELYRWRFLDVAGDERLDYSAHRMKLALVEIPRHAMRLEDYARQLGVHSGDERRTRRGIPQVENRVPLAGKALIDLDHRQAPDRQQLIFLGEFSVQPTR